LEVTRKDESITVDDVETNVFAFGAASWISYGDGLSTHQFGSMPTLIFMQFQCFYNGQSCGQVSLLGGLVGQLSA